MRIGILRDDSIVNPLYRTVIPMNALAARGHEVRWDGKSAKAFNVELLRACDVVHVHRYWDEPLQRLVRHLSDEGVAIWWDNDDDVTAAPRGTAAYREIGGRKGAQILANMRRVMEMADIVTTPSRVLAEQYRQLGAPAVRVLPNQIPDDFPRKPRDARPGRVVIGWTAAEEHRVDAESLGVRATLERVLSTHPEAEVMTIGVRLGLRERYRYVGGVQLSELIEAESAFDIGIAPLADIPLNRARSDIKLKEYAAAGVPWLASPVGPYAELGEKHGGRLVPADGWEAALSDLIRDARGRGKLAKRAARWAKAETIGRHVGAWERTLHEAVERASARAVAA